jgi:hypothetical protein
VGEDLIAQSRRAAGWALVAGLSIAALTAVVALVGGDFDDTEVRVILTSIGFAVASSTATAGTAQLARSAAWLRRLGIATATLSAVAFGLLVAGLWTNMDQWGSESVWRTFGCTGLSAIAASHACVVLGARRRSDRDSVTLLVFASVALGAFDTVAGIVPISGLSDDVDEGLAKLLAATLVLFLLTTVLPPILRRLTRPQDAPVALPPDLARPDTAARREALEFVTSEVVSIAERIDELSRGPALRTPEIRHEAERLRALARSFQA